MYPTIRENEAITVEPVAPQDVKVGDIILYRSGESVVAHRVPLYPSRGYMGHLG
jgi:hypothetical protein